MITCGIREISIISTPDDIGKYEKLFGDGGTFGLSIKYEVQYKPRGIAEAFLIAQDFIANDSVGLILGDNIFHGMANMKPVLDGAVIFAYHVNDPSEYGVVEFDADGCAVSIEEKPPIPKSEYAVPGLYFYDNNVVKYANQLKPSVRGELEITDLNNIYLQQKKLNVVKFPRGTVWLDAGTPETLYQSGAYIQTVQKRQGIKVGCIEEECFRKGFMSNELLQKRIDNLPKSEYKTYLQNLTL